MMHRHRSTRSYLSLESGHHNAMNSASPTHPPSSAAPLALSKASAASTGEQQTSAVKEERTIEMKGASLTAITARVYHSDLAPIDRQLKQILGRSEDFYRQAPIILDLEPLEHQNPSPMVDVTALVTLLRSHGLKVIGVFESPLISNKEGLDTPILSRHRPPSSGRTSEPEQEEAVSLPSYEPESVVVTQPVRGGQKIYAQNAHLTILAAVNGGGEALADGDVHIYGPLRGRALAGAQGNLKAHIFCRSLQAELVAIAGIYQVQEAFPPEFLGKPVMIRLSGEQLEFIPL